MKTMKSNPLTSKQEKFSQLVAAGKSQTDAYRGTFDASKSTDKTIHEKASRLMAADKVKARVDQLRTEHMSKVAEEVAYEYKDAMRECDEAITFAKQNGSAGAYVAALNLKQKISGLHVEDRKNERSPVSDMDAGRVKAALEALAALRKAKAGAIPNQIPQVKEASHG